MTAGDDVGDIKVVDIIDDIIDDIRRACRNSYYLTNVVVAMMAAWTLAVSITALS